MSAEAKWLNAFLYGWCWSSSVWSWRVREIHPTQWHQLRFQTAQCLLPCWMSCWNHQLLSTRSLLTTCTTVCGSWSKPFSVQMSAINIISIPTLTIFITSYQLSECQNTFFFPQGGDGQPPKADGGTHSNSTWVSELMDKHRGTSSTGDPKQQLQIISGVKQHSGRK